MSRYLIVPSNQVVRHGGHLNCTCNYLHTKKKQKQRALGGPGQLPTPSTDPVGPTAFRRVMVLRRVMVQLPLIPKAKAKAASHGKAMGLSL